MMHTLGLRRSLPRGASQAQRYVASDNSRELCHGCDSHPYHWTTEDAAPPFANEFGNVHFYSMQAAFCTSTDAHGRCGAVVPGTTTMAYHDNTHMTRGGATYLAPYLCSAFHGFGLLR